LKVESFVNKIIDKRLLFLLAKLRIDVILARHRTVRVQAFAADVRSAKLTDNILEFIWVHNNTPAFILAPYEFFIVYWKWNWIELNFIKLLGVFFV
jgi:hypothetical protein